MEIPQYITVLNKNREIVALLSPDVDNLKDCFIETYLNAESTLSFKLPLTSKKWEALHPDCIILAEGREFTILRQDAVDLIRENDGTLWGHVTAHETWYLLHKQYATISNDPQLPDPPPLNVTIISGGEPYGDYDAGSAGSALGYLLDNSNWSIGEVDVEGVFDLETERLSILENIQKVHELWGGYLVWDSVNKTVSLRDDEKWQPYNGFQIRYAKNLAGITRIENNDIITRLYPFGYDGLDIRSVNDDVPFIENFQFTNEIYEGVYENTDIYEPQQLLAKATEVLKTLSRPRYTYSVSMVDLRTLPEYSHETFQLGDMVDVIDEDVGANVRVRVVKHRYNVFKPWDVEVDLGDPEDRIELRLAKALRGT